jgi:hypothetical protein
MEPWSCSFQLPDNYYLAFPRDRLYVKSVVYTVFVIETVQTILNAYSVHKMYAAGFGNLAALGDVQIAWFAIPFLTGIGA